MSISNKRKYFQNGVSWALSPQPKIIIPSKKINCTGIVLKDGYICESDTSEYDYWNWPTPSSRDGRFDTMTQSLKYDTIAGTYQRWSAWPSTGECQSLIGHAYGIYSHYYNGGARAYEGYNAGDGLWWACSHSSGTVASYIDINLIYLGSSEKVLSNIPSNLWTKEDGYEWVNVVIKFNHYQRYTGTDYFYITMAGDNRTSSDNWSDGITDRYFGGTKIRNSNSNQEFTWEWKLFKSYLSGDDSFRDVWLKIGTSTRFGGWCLTDLYFEKGTD